MKNRKLLLIVSLVLAMTMSLGGTLAYLQDSDADVNVMTLGSVTIEQHEYQRVGDETDTYTTDTIDNQTSYVLEAYKDGKVLLPIVGDPSVGDAGWDSTTVRMSQVNSYGGMQVFAGKNAQDKFVTVENTGKTPAYVRTFVAIEVGSTTGELIGFSNHFTWDPEDGEELQPIAVAIDGNNYMVYEFVYKGWDGGDEGKRHENGILPAGDTTYPSLAQVYLKSAATNEDMVAIDGNANGTLDILVLSQAIQASGWTKTDDKSAAQVALDTGFGAATKENIQKWFEGDDSTSELPVIFTIDSAEKLQKALNEVASGTTIVLGGNIKGDVVYTQQVDDVVIIDGNGYDFDGNIIVDGGSKQYPNAGLIIKDIDFVSEGIDMDAVINLGDGTSGTRYATNVTISGCTFDVKDAVAVKSYTGGDKNVTIENCTVSERMHSLGQLKGIDGVLVENCKVYAIRGVSFNNSNNVTVNECIFDVQKYALRFGDDANTVVEKYTVTNSELTSANVDDDAVIVFRAGAVNAEVTWGGNTVVAAKENMEYANKDGVTFIDAQ